MLMLLMLVLMMGIAGVLVLVMVVAWYVVGDAGSFGTGEVMMVGGSTGHNG